MSGYRFVKDSSFCWDFFSHFCHGSQSVLPTMPRLSEVWNLLFIFFGTRHAISEEEHSTSRFFDGSYTCLITDDFFATRLLQHSNVFYPDVHSEKIIRIIEIRSPYPLSTIQILKGFSTLTYRFSKRLEEPAISHFSWLCLYQRSKIIKSLNGSIRSLVTAS